MDNNIKNKKYSYQQLKEKYDELFFSYTKDLEEIEKKYKIKSDNHYKEYKNFNASMTAKKKKGNKNLNEKTETETKKYEDIEANIIDNINEAYNETIMKKEKCDMLLKNDIEKSLNNKKKNEIIHNEKINEINIKTEKEMKNGEERSSSAFLKQEETEKIKKINSSNTVDQLKIQIQILSDEKEMKIKQKQKKFLLLASSLNQEIRNLQKNFNRFVIETKDISKEKIDLLNNEIKTIRDNMIEKQRAIMLDFKSQLVLTDNESDFLFKYDKQKKNELYTTNNHHYKLYKHSLSFITYYHENRMRRLSFDITKDYNIEILKKETDDKIKQIELKKEKEISNTQITIEKMKAKNLTSIQEIEIQLQNEEVNKEETFSLIELESQIKMKRLGLQATGIKIKNKGQKINNKCNNDLRKSNFNIFNKKKQVESMIDLEKSKIKKDFENSLKNLDHESFINKCNFLNGKENFKEKQKVLQLEYNLELSKLKANFTISIDNIKNSIVIQEIESENRLARFAYEKKQIENNRLKAISAFLKGKKIILSFIEIVKNYNEKLNSQLINYVNNNSNDDIKAFITSTFEAKKENINETLLIFLSIFNNQIENFMGAKYDSLKLESTKNIEHYKIDLESKTRRLSLQIKNKELEIEKNINNIEDYYREIGIIEGTINSIDKIKASKKEKINDNNVYEKKEMQKKYNDILRKITNAEVVIIHLKTEIKRIQSDIINLNTTYNRQKKVMNSQLILLKKKEFQDSKDFYNIIAYNKKIIQKILKTYEESNATIIFNNDLIKEKININLFNEEAKIHKIFSDFALLIRRFYTKLTAKHNKTYEENNKLIEKSIAKELNDLNKINKKYNIQIIKKSENYKKDKIELSNKNSQKSLVINRDKNINKEAYIEGIEKLKRKRKQIKLIYTDDLKSIDLNMKSIIKYYELEQEKMIQNFNKQLFINNKNETELSNINQLKIDNNEKKWKSDEEKILALFITKRRKTNINNMKKNYEIRKKLLDYNSNYYKKIKILNYESKEILLDYYDFLKETNFKNARAHRDMHNYIKHIWNADNKKIKQRYIPVIKMVRE